MENNLINIKTTIGKDKKTVWELYTDPKHIVNWNFATQDWYCPSAENDLTVSGRFCYRMEAKNGSFGFDFDGTFTQVNPYDKLEYKISDGRVVSIDFLEENGYTVVAISFEPENSNPIEMQRQGWQAILDNFKTYAETI